MPIVSGLGAGVFERKSVCIEIYYSGKYDKTNLQQQGRMIWLTNLLLLHAQNFTSTV